MNIPAFITAIALGASTIFPWIISYPRMEIDVHAGYNEITGQILIPVALACAYFITRQSDWAYRFAWGGLGLALMCIFRIWTGESIAGARMTVGWGVYVAIGVSAVLIFLTRQYQQKASDVAV